MAPCGSERQEREFSAAAMAASRHGKTHKWTTCSGIRIVCWWIKGDEFGSGQVILLSFARTATGGGALPFPGALPLITSARWGKARTKPYGRDRWAKDCLSSTAENWLL